MQIYYSTKFRREYKKLSKEVKLLAEEKEMVFRKDPFDRKLDTHKLHGRLREFWAFSIDNSNRIIFEFANRDIVWFHSVGDHSIYS
ncbi:MAG: type II toxin-antitoxin system YafQ family toxin [Patescibacteria group bacterium]